MLPWILLIVVLAWTSRGVALAELRAGAWRSFWSGRPLEALDRYRAAAFWDPYGWEDLQGESSVYVSLMEGGRAPRGRSGLGPGEAAARCSVVLASLVARAPLQAETWSQVADFYEVLKPENQRRRVYSIENISPRPEDNLEPEDVLQIRALEMAGRVDPNGVYYLDVLGDLYWRLGLRALAISAYEESIVLMPDIEHHPFLDAPVLDPEIREVTVRALSRSVERNPEAESEAVYRHLGMFLLRLERYEEARKAFEKAERSSEGGNYRTLQAYAAAGEGKIDEAIRLYREALSGDSLGVEERFQTLRSLGDLLENAGRHAEAAREVRNALTLVPREPRALLLLGRIYEAQGLIDEAGEQYEKAAANSADPISSLVNLVDFYRRMGRPRQALEAARKLVKLQPGEKVYFTLAKQIQDEIKAGPRE